MEAITNFLMELQTLETSIVGEDHRNRILSLSRYRSGKDEWGPIKDPYREYRNELDLLFEHAVGNIPMNTEGIELLKHISLYPIKNKLEKCWQLLCERPTAEHFNDQLFLKNEFYPLFLKADPGGFANVNQEFIKDLHNIVVIKEGHLAAFINRLPVIKQVPNSQPKTEDIQPKSKTPDAQLKLIDVFKDRSQYEKIMAILVQNDYCSAETNHWIDNQKGSKGFLIGLLKYLMQVGYFKQQISNNDIVFIAKNTFARDVSLRLAEGTTSAPLNYKFIPKP